MLQNIKIKTIGERLMYKLSILLFSTLLFACSSDSSSSNEDGGAISNNRATAPAFSLPSVKGQNQNNGTVTLAQHKGKVVYLFFIGNTCPPCISKGPNAEQIDLAYADDKVVVLALDVWNGSAGAVSNYISQTGVSFPVLRNAGSTGSAYNASNDYSVVVDKMGKIAYRKSGLDKTAIMNTIDSLLKE